MINTYKSTIKHLLGTVGVRVHPHNVKGVHAILVSKKIPSLLTVEALICEDENVIYKITIKDSNITMAEGYRPGVTLPLCEPDSIQKAEKVLAAWMASRTERMASTQTPNA